MPTPLLEATNGCAPGDECIGMVAASFAFGGAAQFSLALEREFSAAGRQVVVVADHPRPPVPSPRAEPRERRAEGDERVAAAAQALSVCDAFIVQLGFDDGDGGDRVLDLLRSTRTPGIVVLQTVPLELSVDQQVTLEAVCDRAAGVVVRSDAARRRLVDGSAVDPNSVHLIPHGSWAPSSGSSNRAAANRPELLTWGSIRPGKGIEHMVKAIGMLDDVSPHLRYTVAGVTDPSVLARDGEQYRLSLIRGAWAARVAPKVCFDDRYRTDADLSRLVARSSIVVLPYDSAEQVTSSVLVESLAAGRPVIATAFPHAVELLSDGAGMLVPHRDPRALAAAVRHALTDPGALEAMTQRAHEVAPDFGWANAAERYLTLIGELDRVRT